MKTIFLSVLFASFIATAHAGLDEAIAAGKLKNYPLRLSTTQPQAEQGEPHAQFNLAMMYWTGQGAQQDYVKAAYWFRKSAEQGIALAQNNIGGMYREGQGVKQDLALAVSWYRKAAVQGKAIAQCNLAIMYDSGQGVKQDYAQAAMWYHKAAEQGDTRAQSNLGSLYATGDGLAQNDVVAYALFDLAANNGNSDAAKGRVVMLPDMSPQQLVAAQLLSREMVKPKNLNKAIAAHLKKSK